MIALDASVLIAFLSRNDVHHRAATALLDEAINSGLDLLVNPVTLAEALVLPTRESRVDFAMAELSAMSVIEVPFPPHAARTLAGLRVVTGLKLPDCCVLLTAMDRQATLASFDQRLLAAAAAQGIAVQAM